ncbi:hypothetical protein E4T42_07027 [Aureobasidium subglaciale]|nr:hypothetical protein E4T38_08628 [Aureobasidium subglaciale]KAI5215030.1 hypothetical protein E4T40_08641 [Aureobasidium subglaciale]KAI5218156.1 hypothetical protein E4T41_08495 [Aureobasidium subglaciale]KAI5244815.1 hypothetical protein E4T42_07027 [Aureobasidium subglaciale]KAI5255927.1 hypothetical protein E4T46_08529 [Aureobasidium subglaciale]
MDEQLHNRRMPAYPFTSLASSLNHLKFLFTPIKMRFVLVTALAAFAVAQSTTPMSASASGSMTISTSSAAPSCAAGQSTCNGVCYDSSEFVCCSSGLCASGSYCGQDSSGNEACCAQNTAGTCSAASTPTSLSRGATVSSGAASATSSMASGSKTSSSSSTASGSQSGDASTATSSGAAAGHVDSWLSNAVTFAAGGLVAAAMI